MSVVGRVLRDAENLVGIPRHSATITFAGRTTRSPTRYPRCTTSSTEPDSTSSLGCVSSASWTCGSKAPSVSISASPSLRERSAQRLLDELYALDELRLLVPLGSLERPLEVVEDRQELAHEPFVRMRDETLLLTNGALAVVLEVRLDALGEVEVLVALRDRATSSGLGSRSLGLRLLDLLDPPASR